MARCLTAPSHHWTTVDLPFTRSRMILNQIVNKSIPVLCSNSSIWNQATHPTGQWVNTQMITIPWCAMSSTRVPAIYESVLRPMLQHLASTTNYHMMHSTICHICWYNFHAQAQGNLYTQRGTDRLSRTQQRSNSLPPDWGNTASMSQFCVSCLSIYLVRPIIKRYIPPFAIYMHDALKCKRIHHCVQVWIPTVDSFTVPLHSPSGRNLPAVRAVQGDGHWGLKNGGNSYWSRELIMQWSARQSQCIFRKKTITKAWCQPIGGYVSYPLTVILPPDWDCVAV